MKFGSSVRKQITESTEIGIIKPTENNNDLGYTKASIMGGTTKKSARDPMKIVLTFVASFI